MKKATYSGKPGQMDIHRISLDFDFLLCSNIRIPILGQLSYLSFSPAKQKPEKGVNTEGGRVMIENVLENLFELVFQLQDGESVFVTLVIFRCYKNKTVSHGQDSTERSKGKVNLRNVSKTLWSTLARNVSTLGRSIGSCADLENTMRSALTFPTIPKHEKFQLTHNPCNAESPPLLYSVHTPLLSTSHPPRPTLPSPLSCLILRR